MGCLKKGLTSHQRHGSAILSQEPSRSSGHTRRVSGGARRLLPPPLRFFRPARAAPALLIATGLVLLFGAAPAWAQVVSITAGAAVTEGGTASFTVTALPTPISDLTVNLKVSQSGTFVDSGNIGVRTVTVPTSGSVSYTVATVGNDTNDDTGSVKVELLTGTGYTVDGTNNTAEVAVNDDDPPVVSITAGAAVTEGGTASFTVTALPTPISDLTVNLKVSQSGTFVDSVNIGDTKTVTVPTSGSVSYTVATVGNDTNDDTGSVKVELLTGTGYTVDGTNNTAEVAVNDDDPPVVSITAGAAVTEGGTASFTVTALPTPISDLTVNLKVSQSGTFVDSVNIGDTKTVTVPTSGSVSYTVATVGNDTNDDTGSVKVELLTGTGYTVDGTNNTAEVAVNDDDPPVVSITAGAAVTEGGTASFTVTALPTPISDLTVNLKVSQSGTFVDSVNIGDTKTVTVPTSGSVSYTVATVGNDTNDDTGSVKVELLTGTGYTVDGTNNTAEVAVNDDDPPVVSITAGAAVTEGGTASFTVTALPTPISDLTVNLKVSQSGTFVDSGNIGVRTVTVPTSGSVSYTVATVGNDTNDDTGSVKVELLTGTGYTVDGTNNTAEVAVNDDDPPVVSITAGAAVTEGGTASFTVTALPTPISDLTVNLKVSQSGTFVDSVNIGDTKTVTVPTSGSVSYTVATVGNDTNDDTGSVKVELLTGTGYTVDGTNNTAEVAVNDDDPPVVSITAGAAVTEGGTASFTVTALPTPISDLTVNLKVSQSGTFVDSGNIGVRTVTVPTSGSVSYTVATVGNDTNDDTGSVIVALRTGTGYTVHVTNNAATVAVYDNIAPDAPSRLLAYAADGAVTLSWNAPGGAAITDYEYQIDGEGEWISIGSARRIHTITGLTNGTVYAFRVRAVNRNGRSRASRRVTATPGVVLDLAHFANGTGILTEIVLVNVSPHPTRPALYFYDTQGNPIDPASLVDVTGDLVVAENGSLTVHTEMQPLSQLTIPTHGRGELVSGSVRVVSGVPISGLVRYSIPGVGVAAVGASPPVRDVLFPVRRQEGGIRTATALHNLQEEVVGVNCRLMSGGVALEEVEIPLEANGQASWFIEEAFPTTYTSDFLGSVRCTVPGNGRFTAIAVEMDAAKSIFTTLPVVPVDRTGGSDGETVLDFAHFANGTWITDLVFMNLSTEASRPALTPFHKDILPSRPAIYFYDTEGNPIAAESVVDITGDLEITEDGALTVQTEMEPLGVLTISTHGRGELVSGSVRVVSDGPIGGMLRFEHPAIGEAVVGASPPLSDALFPVRRQEGGINTGVALHNLESSPGLLRCDLMREGVLLDAASIPLEANGQTSWLIDQAFPAADTSDFAGAVRCDAVGQGLFSAVALEMDPVNRIFATLPVVPVPEMPDQE